METEKKVKMLVYATDDERRRIKIRMNMSMSAFILDSVLEQVASIEELARKEAQR